MKWLVAKDGLLWRIYDSDRTPVFFTHDWRIAYSVALHSARSEAEQTWQQLTELLEEAARP